MEGSHPAAGAAAADTLPVAAVSAGPPGLEGARRIHGDVEGPFQTEERRGLVRPARNWHGSPVAERTSRKRAGELDY